MDLVGTLVTTSLRYPPEGGSEQNSNKKEMIKKFKGYRGGGITLRISA